MSNKFYLSVFKTKNQAVFLYTVLETMGYDNFQIISTPCTIKAGCNYSIKFSNLKNTDIINKEAKELGIEAPEIYIAERKDGKYNYKRVYI